MLSQLANLGMDIQLQTRGEVLVEEVVKTSEIEGEQLNIDAVRSSVAKRLGLPAPGLQESRNRQADGVVELLLDATSNCARQSRISGLLPFILLMTATDGWPEH